MTGAGRSACSDGDPIALTGVDFFDHRIEVADGITLRVLEWSPPRAGEQVEVVFVAGLITVVDSWAPVLRALAERRRVIYIETREKGTAAIPPKQMRVATFSLSEFGADVAAVCGALGMDTNRLLLVGSSLGANAILESLKQGLECRAAFLIGPNIRFFVPWWGHGLLRLPAWAYSAVLGPVMWYLRHFRLDPVAEPEQAQRYERALQEARPDRLKLTLRGLAGYQGLDGLESVDARVGVAFAASDTLHGEQEVRRLVAALPGGEAIECPSNAAMHSPDILRQIDRISKGTQ